MYLKKKKQIFHPVQRFSDSDMLRNLFTFLFFSPYFSSKIQDLTNLVFIIDSAPSSTNAHPR